MNRMEEYRTLMEELSRTPPALETTLDRAAAKQRRKTKRLIRSLAGMAACFAIFVLLVNFCAPVAYACSLVPGLRELAAAVTFSPSLTSAVENEYVQTMDLEQTQNGITARVEYLIVDQKQVNVFYRLDSEIYKQLAADPEILTADGLRPASCGYSTNGYGVENGELCNLSIDFVDGSVPDSLVIRLDVYSNAPTGQEVPVDSIFADIPEGPVHYLAAFEFLLEFDPQFTAAGKIIPVNETVLLEGQRITIRNVELYPSHIRVEVAEAEDNTAWLKGLNFYIETDRGMQFEPVANGIVSTGSPDTPSMVSYRAESTYFYEAEHLRLVITGAKWLRKDMETTYLNLRTGQSGPLPEGAAFESAERQGTDWVVTFQAAWEEGEPMYQLFGHEFFDADGNAYEINMWSSTYGEPEESGEITYFLDQFPLKNYPYEEVWLSPHFSHNWTAETPVTIIVQ